MKGHLKHMLIGGAVIFAALLVAGVDVGNAGLWAILLVCPLMMVGMMWMMSRGHAGHTGQGAAQDRPDSEVRDRDGAIEHQHH
ncbi:hypothetical protein N866_05365 [Actinotalea ferrariae CF5-4]|uniref:DUF2933 domain-containing protein n=1 Tax=Actinotalea ferrariae CF5-4 TaxID=948458 RepID=A0A021VNM8_9CELL|nr:hypothetical protein [Actinotalea ferrariae]EYR62784.1 hypothetical protein N866_05365 [Actinotalea ferrariae CF5-4]